MMDPSYREMARWFMMFLFMGAQQTASSSYFDSTYTRVVESPVVLICPTTVIDIEIVRWKKDATILPILSYYPKDGNVQPEDHDQRLSIRNDKDLVISSLESADSGNYTCVIASSTLPGDVTYLLQLKIEAGCLMPVIPEHLTTSEQKCGSGSYIGYTDECNFTCPHGYTMIGDMSTECQANGTLSNDLPRCQESSCYINSLPEPPIKVKYCSQCSRISYGHNCTFSCETGYELKGANVATCLNTGELDSPYPTCEELETGHQKNLLPLLALIIIPVGIASGAIFICIRKKVCKRKSPAPKDAEETVPLEKVGKQRDTKVTFEAVKDDHPTKAAKFPYQNLPKDLKILFKKFRPLLINQLSIDRRPDILRRIHEIEVEYILPQVASIDVDDKLKEFVKKCSVIEMSRKEAFALYITVLLSFIDDRQMTKLAQHEIIAITGHHEVEESYIKYIVPDDQHLLEDKKNIDDYLEIVLKAFTILLKTERSSIDDQQTKNEQTSQMSNVTMRFIRENPTSTKLEDVSSRSKSTAKEFEESNEDDEYFAKLCVKAIRQFDHLKDSVKLRHNMLDTLFAQNTVVKV